MHLQNRVRLSQIALTLLALASLSVVSAGCGGGGGSNSGTSLTSTTSPTKVQTQTGTDAASEAVDMTTSALEPLNYLSEGDATRSRAEGRPTVTVTRGGGEGVSVTIDYGTGITGAGGVTRSGTLTVAYDRTARSGSVTFSDYTVNGHTVSGTVSLSQLTVTSGSVSFVAASNLTFPGVTAIQSSLTITLSSGTLAVPTGTLTVTPASGAPYTASINGMTIIPATASNFIPSSGVITATYPYTTPIGTTVNATIAVTFTDQSPSTGVVLVSVNGGPQTPYMLSHH